MTRLSRFFFGMLAAGCLLAGPIAAAADRADSGEQVMQQFIAGKTGQSAEAALAEQKTRHQILFVMGFALLIGIGTTVGLGIAMALYHKPVFVAHMIAAGFSLTLAIVHAIVAIVWFYPS